MEKATLLEIARELKLNRILENESLSEKEVLLAILKYKSSDINWSDMKYQKNISGFDKFLNNKEDIPHSHILGNVKCVAEYGGEGKGEDYWLVAYFEKYDVYIRIDGWYTSYEGSNFDGDPYIVEPKEKVVIVYEPPK